MTLNKEMSSQEIEQIDLRTKKKHFLLHNFKNLFKKKNQASFQVPSKKNISNNSPKPKEISKNDTSALEEPDFELGEKSLGPVKKAIREIEKGKIQISDQGSDIQEDDVDEKIREEGGLEKLESLELENLKEDSNQLEVEEGDGLEKRKEEIENRKQKTDEGVDESDIGDEDEKPEEQGDKSEYSEKEEGDMLEEVREANKSLKYRIAEDMPRDEPPMIPKGEYHFPKGFLWGTATSGYQVEGGNHCDWSEWEASEPRVKNLKKKGLLPEDYICGEGVNHYKKYQEDIRLAAGLNNNAIRIGLEWARIQPDKDTWDVTVINHYKKVLKTAHEHGLKTVVTLWHWTNPVWLSDEGAWANKSVKQYFGDYVDFVIQELGGDIDYWVTLNEPMLQANYGYFMGYFPPNKRNPFKFYKASNNLIKAHKIAYKKIHDHFPHAQVSITNLSNCFRVNSRLFVFEHLLVKIVEWLGHDRFFNKIKDHIDYVGIDYYRRIYLSFFPPFIRSKNHDLTDMGWEIYPEGIYELLKKFSKYKKPILILENGLADKHDKHRANFIKEHLYYIHKAIDEGVEVKGYFHWSLLDNFEWDKGWDPQFGLYKINRQTFERIERPSARVYREICEENKVVVDS